MASFKFYPATAEHSYSGYRGVAAAFQALGFEEVSKCLKRIIVTEDSMVSLKLKRQKLWGVYIGTIGG